MIGCRIAEGSLDQIVEHVRGHWTVVVIVDLDDRRLIADPEAAVDYLYAETGIAGRFAIGNAVGILQSLHQLLRAENVAGHAVTDEQVVMTSGRGAKIGVKGEQTKHSSQCRSEMRGNHLCCFGGDPTEMFIDFLKRGEDELLSLFEIAVGEVGKQFPYNVEIDFLTSGKRRGNGKNSVIGLGLCHSATSLPQGCVPMRGRCDSLRKGNVHISVEVYQRSHAKQE